MEWVVISTFAFYEILYPGIMQLLVLPRVWSWVILSFIYDENVFWNGHEGGRCFVWHYEDRDNDQIENVTYREESNCTQV